MAKRFHGESPGNPAVCLCGEVIHQECRGGIPVLRAETNQQIHALTAAGESFQRTAELAGVSAHIVKRIIHG
jgi:hypothetical protein